MDDSFNFLEGNNENLGQVYVQRNRDHSFPWLCQGIHFLTSLIIFIEQQLSNLESLSRSDRQLNFLMEILCVKKYPDLIYLFILQKYEYSNIKKLHVLDFGFISKYFIMIYNN